MCSHMLPIPLQFVKISPERKCIVNVGPGSTGQAVSRKTLPGTASHAHRRRQCNPALSVRYSGYPMRSGLWANVVHRFFELDDTLAMHARALGGVNGNSSAARIGGGNSGSGGSFAMAEGR